MPTIHDQPTTEEEIERNVVLIRQQTRELVKQLGVMKLWPRIPCACCAKSTHLKDAYRCYYCGLYFCTRCAPEHFGGERPDVYQLPKGAPS